jgi:hypothetical protein
VRRALPLACALAGVLASSASAAPSPAGLLRSVISAAGAQHSMHYVSTSVVVPIRITQVADVGVDRGIQRITYRHNGRAGRVTVIVVGGAAYVRGDSLALVSYMGFKPGAAAKFGQRWVKIPAGDRIYGAVAADVTLASALGDLKLSPPLAHLPSTTRNGVRVITVAGKLPTSRTAAVTLYARASGAPLPVAEVFKEGTSQGEVTFSRWNVPVTVRAPAHAVPIAATGLE